MCLATQEKKTTTNKLSDVGKKCVSQVSSLDLSGTSRRGPAPFCIRGWEVARRVRAERSGNHQTWFALQPCTYFSEALPRLSRGKERPLNALAMQPWRSHLTPLSCGFHPYEMRTITLPMASLQGSCQHQMSHEFERAL